MRTSHEIEHDIEKTRERLQELYAEQREFNSKNIKLCTNKFYLFKDPDDESVEYCGKLIEYGYNKYDDEYWFNVTGVQRCLSEYRDSCWSSFDAMYYIYVRSDKLKSFIDNFVEITREAFYKKVDALVVDTVKYIKYYIDD